MPFQSPRIEKLRRLVRKKNAAAMLVTNFTNVSYLTGFTGDDSYLLVTASGQTILTDSRYTQQLDEECPGLDQAMRGTGVKMVDFVAEAVAAAKIGSLAIEADSMTVQLFSQLRENMPSVDMVPTSGVVESLRIIKDKDEIREIRLSIDLAQKAFGVIRASLRPEMTEREVAHDLEHQIRLFGGRGCSFRPIVAVGPRAALPHATPGKHRIEESGFVLIDWGAIANQYLSDLTRVLVTARIPPKLETIYGVVLKAQQQAIAAIKPGAILAEVDAVAREVIGKAGFGKYFGHGLGHGIGMQIHESPRMAPNQNDPFQVGMVVTVEPGIYIPGWGGVRIEDDVLVTRDGHEVLSSVPREFADCVIS